MPTDNQIFTMTIHLGNDAMQTTYDVAVAIRRIADRLEAGDVTGLYQNVLDVNGNPVGTWKFKNEED